MEKFNKSFESGEYEGTLIIDKSGTVECNNSTFWAYNKNVVKIKASGVILKNARIELLSGNACAIDTDFPDLILENVEVKGNIKGLPFEPEIWSVPSLISLGEFASDCENIFCINIDVPVECHIENTLYGVEISPLNLKKGANSLRIAISPMRSNTILYGEIFIKSAVKRRIYINGKAVGNAPQIKQSDIPALRKGQRICIDEYYHNNLRFVFEKKSVRKNMDIDSYAFCLGENGKAYCDEDLIFFGNICSKDNSVKTGGDSQSPEVFVSLSKLDSRYSKIAVCFAIYGDDSLLNFSLVDSPAVRIFSGEEEIYKFSLDSLNIEKTVVAIELYRYKNQWKMNCIGSGYRDGLKKLCESYGIEVDS